MFFSTLSSGISALAAITWKDLIEPWFPNMKEFNKTVVTKILCELNVDRTTFMSSYFKLFCLSTTFFLRIETFNYVQTFWEVLFLQIIYFVENSITSVK